MRTSPAEILTISALELSRRLHSRELTAVELLKTTLDRIDEVNTKIRAIVALRKDRDKLFKEAQEADIELDSFATHANVKAPGWLRGIPLCIKDLEDVKGLPTTRGGCPLLGQKISKEKSLDRKDFYLFDNGWVFKNADEDAAFVKRLRDAGAIIIGKTNTPELGMGCHSYNTIHGTTLNPFDLSRTAGGSSGGAAAALASNMLCVSDGSDMMGSLRNPAGYNNLYSLRPTSSWMEENDDDVEDDNVDKNGVELTYPISTIGPIARCPEDLAMFLETILPEGHNGFDASTVLDCSAQDLDAFVKNSKIGWLNDWGGSIPYENEVIDHCRQSLKTFEVGGASINTFTQAPFSNDDLWESWMVIRSHKIFDTLQERIGCDAGNVIPILKAHSVKPEAIWECEQGKCLTEQQLNNAVDRVNAWSRCADELFKSHDFLALPSSQIYPFDAAIDWPKSIAGKKMDTYHRWMNVMVPVTVLGLPCVTVPCGVGLTGLPMGLSIFGRKGEDSRLLMLASWYHKNSVAANPRLAV